MAQVTEAFLQEHFFQVTEIAQTVPVVVTRDGQPLAVVLSPERFSALAGSRRPAAIPGFAADLLAGLDVEKLLAVDITDTFEGYL